MFESIGRGRGDRADDIGNRFYGTGSQFDLANGGTIFLDEIDTMSSSLQVRLLRLLQQQSFYRVGGETPIKTNVRVVAATNKDLEAEVEAGRFREDLFYRFNVVRIKLPPLSHRREDIPLLVTQFISKYGRIKFTDPDE